MKTIKLFLTLAAGLFLAACSEDNIGEQYEILGLGGDTEAQTELDRWLYDNITGPLQYGGEIPLGPFGGRPHLHARPGQGGGRASDHERRGQRLDQAL